MADGGEDTLRERVKAHAGITLDWEIQRVGVFADQCSVGRS